MATSYTTLISAAQRIQLPGAFVADCSHDLAYPQASQLDCAAAHIPAFDRDLSASMTGCNGRYPLLDNLRSATFDHGCLGA